MRIAIVGAGISGLACAYFLRQAHEITVFEADDRLGGHTHTIDVPVSSGSLAVDTGFIVYNDRTYPLFNRLLEEIGVGGKPTRMSFSVKCERSGWEYRGADLNGMFAQRRNVLSWRYWRFLADLVRFNRTGLRFLTEGDDLTVREFFQREKFSAEFRERYFLPMASAVWSCPHGAIEEFPIRFVLEFYRHHGLLSLRDRPQWRVIEGGSRSYLEPLTRSFRSSIQRDCAALGVRRSEHAIEVRTSRGETAAFDHVVFACHADQTLRILGQEASSDERALLEAFPYEENEVTLHTDISLLPQRRRAWACWNYLIPREERRKATVTYDMNQLQSLNASETYCVTLNARDRIDPAKILRNLTYHHPVFDRRREEMQRRHKFAPLANRVSFCGAYWGNGFHEDGVRSAWETASKLGGMPAAWNHVCTKDGSDTGDSLRSPMPSNIACS